MPALAAVPCQPGPSWRSSIIAASPAMRSLLDQIERVAPSTVPALLTGETGTGKDLLARALHEASGRPGPFVPVNCAALPEPLVESELLGHARGAFTGASMPHEGLIARADRGTLLLDEVGDLPLAAQAKLLRVLEDGLIRPVGSTSTVQVNVRIVCATNRDLTAAVQASTFRADLYHRITGVTLHILPLRSRPRDIEPLVQHFLCEFCDGRPVPPLSDTTLTALRRRPWPGNVRELRNAVRRAVLLGGEVLTPEDFAPEETALACERAGTYGDAIPLEGRRWCDVERTALVWAVRRYGNTRAAALALGLPRTTFCDRLRRHGIARRTSLLP